MNKEIKNVEDLIAESARINGLILEAYKNASNRMFDDLNELDRLSKWKTSAKLVFSNLRLQEVGKELEIGLGEDIAINVLPKIQEMKHKIIVLESTLADIKVAVSRIPHANYEGDNWPQVEATCSSIIEVINKLNIKDNG